MPADVKLSYVLNAIGWAMVRLKVDEKEIFINPSYLSEPLIDMVDGILSITPGMVPDDELKEVVSFDMNTEPCIYKWIIRRLANNLLSISIIFYENEVTEVGVLEFEGICHVHNFISELVNVLQQLLVSHGIVGYKETWYGKEFPISGYLKLYNYINNNVDLKLEKYKGEYGIELSRSNLDVELQILKNLM